jgi:hypothetical protein
MSRSAVAEAANRSGEKLIFLKAIDILAPFAYTVNVRIVRIALLMKGAKTNGTCKDNLERADYHSR